MKWLALRSPIPWPKGFKTGRGSDPKRDGTRPQNFDQDRDRVISSLRSLASASKCELSANHPVFGPMNLADWHVWADRHHGHHLKQFGL